MNKAIVIFGPTSSGKTTLSIQLADHLKSRHGRNSEIISVDSRQLYRYMDIGTAKVSLDTRQVYPHHFIDILDPDEHYDTDQYAGAIQGTLREIFERGNLPILVGGSGTVLMGVIGACHLIGATESSLGYETLLLIPASDRPSLYRRIEKSIDEMFHCGLYREVKQIISHGGRVPRQLKVTTGYREFVEYAAKNRRNIMTLNRQDLERIKQQVKVHTKKYAMHQLGWLPKLRDYYLVEANKAEQLVDEFMHPVSSQSPN